MNHIKHQYVLRKYGSSRSPSVSINPHIINRETLKLEFYQASICFFKVSFSMNKSPHYQQWNIEARIISSINMYWENMVLQGLLQYEKIPTLSGFFVFFLFTSFSTLSFNNSSVYSYYIQQLSSILNKIPHYLQWEVVTRNNQVTIDTKILCSLFLCIQ